MAALVAANSTETSTRAFAHSLSTYLVTEGCVDGEQDREEVRQIGEQEEEHRVDSFRAGSTLGSD